MEVNHKNGARVDDRAENLEWLSHQANVVHSLDVLGAQRAKGEENGQAKLSADKVRQIRRLKDGGESFLELSKRFGVSRAAIWYVVSGRSWRHVERV